MPKGDYAYFDAGRDYPAEARALGIEGAIRVRLVVDEHGKVASRVLLNRLGHGLDELALKRAADLEFEPARDTDDHPVTVAIVWTFHVTLPKNAQPLSAPGAPSVSDQPASPGGMQIDPVDPVEVSKMPLPGHCAGKYTDEARAAATEGVVVLDVIVDEHGHVRDITVVEGLPHGLTEAAIEAVRVCPFTPGERNGRSTPVRIRGYKVRFLMRDPT